MENAQVRLFIANRRYSTWSMRAWLYLRAAGVEPAVTQLRIMSMQDENHDPLVCRPDGAVPCIAQGRMRVSGAISILRYCAEQFGDERLWTTDPARAARWFAFCEAVLTKTEALRHNLPLVISERPPPSTPDPLISSQCGEVMRFFLEGRENAGVPESLTLLDLFLVPFFLRFQQYGVHVIAPLFEYGEKVLTAPGLREWQAQALLEPETMPHLHRKTS